MTKLTLSLIREADRLLAGKLRQTPIEHSPALSEICGVEVRLKLENLQETGSFKVRGAYFALSRLTQAERRRGVITCSGGNHGKAVAYVGKELGVPARIHVPKSVDEAKLRSMRHLGADVVRSKFDGFDDTEENARRDAAKSGRTWISAYDDPIILAANGGTLALEALRQWPEARTFVLPVGGGGLGGGFSYVVKKRHPTSRFIACQHADSPALQMSLERGEAVTRLPGVETTAGGLEGGIGRTGFSVLQSLVDDVALITEEEIFDAVRWMLEHHQYVMEPTSAVVIAALLTKRVPRLKTPTLVVISGRNLSVKTLRRILD
ncbi:MAG TPA: pyridoxal-phosphate dependent enzyme [Candidatus Thermoplasmatota archaeon]